MTDDVAPTPRPVPAGAPARTPFPRLASASPAGTTPRVAGWTTDTARPSSRLFSSAPSPAAAPAWWMLTLTSATGYLVLVQDRPGADWMVWCGPPARDGAVSSLRYRHPDTGAVTAAAVAVFPTIADARAAWADYLYGGIRPPRFVPYAQRVVSLSAAGRRFGAAA